jgi:drug/metabolite transporter (DMT)-like permease
VKKLSIPIILSYLAIYIVWGSTYFFIKMGVESIPPFYLVGFRFLFGGLGFLAISLAAGQLRKMPTLQEMLAALFLGSLLLLLGNGFVSLAERSVDSYLAALFIASTPFCVAFFNRIFFKEKLPLFRLLGMLSGILGVGLILYNGSNILSSFTPGVGLIFVGLLCWALATSVGHKIKVHPNNLVNSGMQMLFAGILGVVFSSFIYPPLPALLPTITVRSWIGLSYLTVLGGMAFYCYAYLIKNEPSIRVVSYSIINPVIAVALGICIGNEKPAHFLLLGFPLVLLGLVLMMYGGRIFSTAALRREARRQPE